MGNCQGSAKGPDEKVCIVPQPCWVVKTKTKETNSKVFLNVVHHVKIPESPDKRNPRIFIGSRKISKDKKGDECTVIDVLVHSGVVQGIDDGESPAAARLNRNIITLMNLAGEGDDDDTLGMQFSIPKIPAGYKGDEVTPIEQTLIDFAASEKARKGKKSVTTSEVVLMGTDGSAVGGGDDSDAMGGTVEVIDIDAHAGTEGTDALEQASKGFLGRWMSSQAKTPATAAAASAAAAAAAVNANPSMTPEEAAAAAEMELAAEVAAAEEAERLPPAPKGGTFRKQGHFVPTMRTRFVHLDKGRLSYYTNEKMTDCKKALDLADCYISNDPKIFFHQIYIAPLDVQKGKKAGGRDLLLEMLEGDSVGGSDFKIEWIQAIRSHIRYATRMRIDAGKPSPI